MARPPYRDPHYWVTTKSKLYCALGAHDVSTGTRVRYRRNDYRQLGSCEACLAAAGLVQTRRVTLVRDDGFDARRRRSGDE